MNRHWRWYLPGYVFVLPMTLIGIVIGLVFYKARRWYFHDGVLGAVAGTARDGSTLIWGKPWAQTLGWVVFYDSEPARDLVELRVHEYTHVTQAFLGSLFGAVVCPLLALLLGGSPWAATVWGGLLGGLGFAILYGVLFLYLFIRQGGGDWYTAYRANPFEIQAYGVQDRYVCDVEKGMSPRPWGV